MLVPCVVLAADVREVNVPRKKQGFWLRDFEWLSWFERRLHLIPCPYHIALQHTLNTMSFLLVSLLMLSCKMSEASLRPLSLLSVVPKLDKLIAIRDGWMESGSSVEKLLGLDHMLIKRLLFLTHHLAMVSALCMAKWIVFLLYSGIVPCSFLYVCCQLCC